MTTHARPDARPPVESGAVDARTFRVALLGNPNTGKTTIFNRLCGLRAKTANFPGVTVEARIGSVPASVTGAAALEMVDLPGVYRLSLALPESNVCRDILNGSTLYKRPDRILVVVDATNLARNLCLVGEVLRYGLPTVVALNMTDMAQRQGLTVDTRKLSQALGCPVIATVGRVGVGLDDVRRVLAQTSWPAHEAAKPEGIPPLPAEGAEPDALEEWAEACASESLGGRHALGRTSDTVTERLDLAFTHPILGLAIFAAVMAGLFTVIFRTATIPMDLIDAAFSHMAAWTSETLPEGAINDLISEGVIGGVSGTVIFLPQICLLFFLLSLLEDTGYLARAAFVMDRIMCRFGLPGQAFVPLLSSHACALPGIMSTRLIPDRQDRLTTILVAPFMSCSARVPVYVLLTSILFRGQPYLAGLAFFGCYALGAVAGLFSALLARKFVLRGASRPMVLELPSYKLPSLRTALLTTVDRGLVFLKRAGTVILAICVILWWLSAYPKVEAPAEATVLREQAALVAAVQPEQAKALEAEASQIENSHATRHSFAGQMGQFVQPVFAPLGYDWRLTIGVMTSFAAREVFVSTMAVLILGDEELDPTEDESALDRIANAKRDDGTTPVFTAATSVSVLVFFVLAMQCLPTLAVTRREAGHVKWALLQLAYMSALAWVFALGAYQLLRIMGVS